MKKYKKIILALFFTLCLTGCGDEYASDESYDTDIIGKFLISEKGWIGGDQSDAYQHIQEYTFKDTAYIYYHYNSINIPDGYNEEGSYSLNNINDDIDYISLDGDEDNQHTYKYKNMMGWYIPINEIPKGKKFNLTIENTNPEPPSTLFERTEDTDFDDIIFTDDGKLYLSINAKNFNPEEATITYDYIRKNNIIYRKVDGGWDIMYYIVDDGIFAPELYKTEE